MFILFDGKKSAAEIVAAAAGMGVTTADVNAMVELGFLAPSPNDGPSTIPAPAASVANDIIAPQARAASGRTDQQRYQDAKPLATKLTAGLGLRGFRLNLAVEAAAGVPELLALLPKIQEAVGTKACRELEQALKG